MTEDQTAGPGGVPRPAILSLRGLRRHFHTVAAVDDIDLEIKDGEFFTIVGPSGSGKTTLIRILAGLERADAGTVLLRGEDITATPANRRPTCMVFQSLALFNHRSVGENIEFSMKMRGVDRPARRKRGQELLQLVHLPEDYYDRPVTQCSGGERQRVALARALASDPEVLFFDEPLSAIDYRLRKILQVELKDLHRETGKTFIFITHSLEEAMVMSDRIAIMRKGRIVQIGEPLGIYEQPNSRFVAEFMGDVNIFTLGRDPMDNLILEEVGARLDVRKLDLDGDPTGYLVVRPEHLRPLSPRAKADVSFLANVFNDYMLGSRTQFHARHGDTRLIGEVAGAYARSPRPGEELRLGFDLEDAAFVKE